MKPVLIQFGSFVLRSYGAALSLSFVAGIYLAWLRAPRYGVDRQRLFDICLVIVVAALLGSRLLYVAEHAASFAGDPSRAVAVWEGGLSMYGGVLLAALAAAGYCRWQKIPFLSVADTCAPSLALGESITRIGCFLNGCCFGTASSLPWAMVFPPRCPAGRALPGVHIHPTQLYASLLHLAIFAVVLRIVPAKPGRAIGTFLVLHAIARLVVETLRYHEPSALTATVGGVALTPSRLVCLTLIAMGTYVLMASRAQAPVPARATRVR